MERPRKRYHDLNTYFRSIFGCRVHKVSLDAGLTCPNRDGTLSTGGCLYCNEKGSGTGAYRDGLSITRQLIAGKEALGKRYKAEKFLAYFQSFSNTYAPIEILRSLYQEALSVKDIVGLSIGTRPDCVNESVLKLLEEYAESHLIWVEYGIQSVHDSTLKRINRGHDFRCFAEAVEKTKNRRINICAHVILGLPGENREHMLETARTLSKMGINGVKIHLLYVVRGTELEKIYNQGIYTCMEQKEYVETVCDFLERLPPEMVIQRLTGDPHDEELVAPLWTARRNRHTTFTQITEILEKRDSWQGKYFAL